jgi:alpha-D-xyloside xylohydrolase
MRLPTACAAAALAMLVPAASRPGSAEKPADGLVLAVGGGHLKIAFCADDVVRVAFARDPAFFDRPSLAAGGRRCGPVSMKRADAAGQATLSTSKMKVRVDLGTAEIAFLDARGTPILVEKKGGRTLVPAEVQGEKTFHARQEWRENDDESLYGLGQHQLGLMDIKGYDLDLWQHNATVIVPFLVSSRGYGILWDNTSFTRFGDLREWAPIPAGQLLDATGKPGGLTGSYHAGPRFENLVATRVDGTIDVALPGTARQPNLRIHPSLPAEGPISVRWEGAVEVAEPGDHLFQLYSNGGIKMWVDGRLVADHWRQGWLPWKDLARATLAKGRHALRVEWSKDQGMETVRLLWKPPARERSTSLWSEVGEGVDYYFVYGPALDRVVAGYRRLTGEAPMMPRWAFGLWQSRQRYETQQQSLDVVDGFRSRRIPFDNIVQDWFYWPEDAWGSHRFDPARFPDPDGWVRAIHDRNARLMISVWGKFYPGNENFEAMRAKGFLYESTLRSGFRDWVGRGYPYVFFDAFSPGARRLFWEQVERALFRRGVDAWWMDATEPDLVQPMPELDLQRAHMHPTAMGSGARVLNAYSLVNSQGVYEGQRAAAPDQRVFILTRSAFAGQQRYAAATWSGDITSTWTAMRQQIAGGLGFSLSGIPYWTVDIGGFSVPGRFSRRDPSPEDAEEWRELNTRWFQHGTFLPLTRVHGEAPKREMWEIAPESHPAYQAHLKFDRLRYRMLPYLYSLAGAVTHESGSFLRPLVMDFPADAAARRVADQYLFGPAFLVSPVTEYKARRRPVLLPGGATWYDFWTGAAIAGGQTVDAPAPYDAMPLHVRAGSIVPFGPELQWTGEKPADPVTLFVYAGADGAFTLYEDDGLTYDYEKGAFSRIPLRWNDATGTLTIGKREGSFPGMLAQRTFEVVLVAKGKPVGFSFEPKPDRTVRYDGAEAEVELRSLPR